MSVSHRQRWRRSSIETLVCLHQSSCESISCAPAFSVFAFFPPSFHVLKLSSTWYQRHFSERCAGNPLFVVFPTNFGLKFNMTRQKLMINGHILKKSDYIYYIMTVNLKTILEMLKEKCIYTRSVLERQYFEDKIEENVLNCQRFNQVSREKTVLWINTRGS